MDKKPSPDAITAAQRIAQSIDQSGFTTSAGKAALAMTARSRAMQNFMNPSTIRAIREATQRWNTQLSVLSPAVERMTKTGAMTKIAAQSAQYQKTLERATRISPIWRMSEPAYAKTARELSERMVVINDALSPIQRMLRENEGIISKAMAGWDWEAINQYADAVDWEGERPESKEEVAAGVVQRLADNTKNEINQLGLLGLLFLFLSILPFLMESDFTDEDRATLQATYELVVEFGETMEANASAIETIAAMERGVVKSPYAHIRIEPLGTSERQARLPHDTNIAIEEVRGKWLLIHYSDEVMGEPVSGWVWAGSIERYGE